MNKLYASLLIFLFLCLQATAAFEKNREIMNLKIVDSEFHGNGTGKSQYVIKSSESNQINGNTHLLKNITGTYNDLEKKNLFSLSAPNGSFNSDDEILDLYEQTIIKFNEYNLSANKISVDLNKKIISSKDFTNIKGLNEKITSQNGFTNVIKEKTVYFHGPITTTLIRK